MGDNARRTAQVWRQRQRPACSVRRGGGELWLLQFCWSSRLENERSLSGISNFMGIRGRGRGFPARVPATASGEFCPPSPSPQGKFPAYGAPFGAFPTGIPAAWGTLTGLIEHEH
ncbi:hypothetical protein PIB30_091250 [Stylosanthes scabra]|uniref:Uncharacterized protein n=1 Tax=Stylosanthes scabra TaxID=79078 RepID=A0ABU6TVX4_9FABA|nr:hypothetical protein [Stylosanthes scabra]